MAWTRGSHHLPPYSILCTSPRRLHWNGFLSRDSQRGIPKLPRLELLQLCGAITSRSDLWSRQGLKQNCSSRRELSNGVSHTTYTHGNRVDSWYFVVRSQTVNLPPDLSFYHNLCYRCPNGSCEPILNIYTLIDFQWYKKLLYVRGFDDCKRSLKVWESTGTLTPKVGIHLWVWVFILTLFLPLLLAHTLASLRFGREPKARVTTWGHSKFFFFGFYFWGLVVLYMLIVASFLLDKCLEIVIMRSLELGMGNNE
jgi:hypothetical protein